MLNILNVLNVDRYILFCKHKGKNKQHMDIFHVKILMKSTPSRA